MRKFQVLFIIVFLSIFSSQAYAAKPITLNLVSFVPKTNIHFQKWSELFVDKINKRANGELVIKYRGGPEIISPFDLGMSVSKGINDMALISTTFYTSLVPGADTNRFSELTTAEERKNGTYDLLQELHAKKGIYYLGELGPIRQNGYFYICLRNPVKTKEDFKGLKLGGSPPFLPVFKALGSIPVRAALKEYYTSVERGVIDGNIVGLDVYSSMGEQEVAPFIIDHPAYKSVNVTIINKKKWDSLPDHLKELIKQVQLETEQSYPEIWDREQERIKKQLIADGAKFIKLEPDVAKWYVDTFYTVGWKYAEDHYPKDVIARFKKLITKQ